MSSKYPNGAPNGVVVTAFEVLRFRVVQEGEHVSMVRHNPDGTRTFLTMPSHPHIKGCTISVICAQVDVL